MPSSVCFPPVECCLGTRPCQAATCRPSSKHFTSPTVATKALAVIGAIPGISSSFRLASLSRCHVLISRSNSSTCRSISFKCSPSRCKSIRNWPGRPFSPSSRSCGSLLAIYPIPCGSTTPYSPSNPRIWLACAVRALTKPWRARCKDSTLCCSVVLIGTKRILGRATASQIPSASATSFLFVFI